MGLRFRRSARLGPFRITATKTGLSGSFGVRGARIGINSRGQVRRTIGIPGTGIYDTEVIHSPAKGHPTPTPPTPPTPPSAEIPREHPWRIAIVLGVIVVTLTVIGVIGSLSSR